MKRMFLILPIIGMLASCSKDESRGIEMAPSEGEVCSLTVGLGLSTRSTSITAENEEAVSSLQVFVFRGDALDAYGSVSSAREITLSCTSGERTVVALVNAPDLSSVSSRTALLGTTSLLSDNSATAFEMVGSRTVTLPQASTVTVDVQRMVSRVVLSKVKREFSSSALSSLPFTIEEIFLINVAGDNSYGLGMTPSIWFNKRAYGSEQSTFTYDAPGASVANGGTYSTEHTFFAYANPTVDDTSSATWSPRHTRLVLKTRLGDDTYYYPITLPVLEPNKSYEIENLTLTRPGSDDPDVPVTFTDCTFDINVLPWTSVEVSDGTTI